MTKNQQFVLSVYPHAYIREIEVWVNPESTSHEKRFVIMLPNFTCLSLYHHCSENNAWKEIRKNIKNIFLQKMER